MHNLSTPGGGSVETASSNASPPTTADVGGGTSAASADGGASTASTKLIVNYLPQAMTQDELRALFASVGDVESCKLIRDRGTGQSLGYAFVNYLLAEDASRAIASLNGLRLQNKTIKVSLARPSNESIKGANLYVSGLPKSVTQTELEAVFRPFGNIITSKILCDVNSGLSRGVGFVRFDRRDEAEYAIERMSGAAPFAGCVETIQVKFANNPAAAVQKAMSLQTAAAAAANSTLLPVSMLHSPAAAHAAAMSSLAAGGIYKLATTTGGNVGPIHHTPQINKFRYSPLAGAPIISSGATAVAQPTTAVINPILMGSAGAAASTDLFATNAALLQMAAANGGLAGLTSHSLATLNGGAVLATQAPAFAALSAPLFSASTANGGILPTTVAVGLTGNGVNGGISVFIYNLEPEADDSVLWKLFGPFGAVQSVRVMKDLATNKCKGYGFVTMKNHEEAFAAVTALNGTQLGNRILQVSFKSS